MKGHAIIMEIAITGIVLFIYIVTPCCCQTSNSVKNDPMSILIVYHGGKPPWHEAPPLEEDVTDVLTQATPRNVNVKVVAERIRKRLSELGFRIDIRIAEDVHGPHEFLDYDGIIFGTPTWFSNVAYPIKKIFDEYLIRIYEHRPGRLNDKALAGFTTVMDRTSGPLCLQSLNQGLEHLSKKIIEGIVINTGDKKETIDTKVQRFCERFSRALKEK